MLPLSSFANRSRPVSLVLALTLALVGLGAAQAAAETESNNTQATLDTVIRADNSAGTMLASGDSGTDGEPAPGIVKVYLVDADNQPFTAAVVHIYPDDDGGGTPIDRRVVDANGVVTIDDLPAGTYRFCGHPSDYDTYMWNCDAAPSYPSQSMGTPVQVVPGKTVSTTRIILRLDAPFVQITELSGRFAQDANGAWELGHYYGYSGRNITSTRNATLSITTDRGDIIRTAVLDEGTSGFGSGGNGSAKCGHLNGHRVSSMTATLTRTDSSMRLLNTPVTVQIDSSACPFRTFVDVLTTSPFFTEIEWLAGKGISTGWVQPDGSKLYQPLEPVHRDAMAAFMYRYAGSPDFTPPTMSPFTDVAPTQPFYKEVCWLKEQGISTGWPDGTFRPLGSVNRDAWQRSCTGSPR